MTCYGVFNSISKRFVKFLPFNGHLILLFSQSLLKLSLNITCGPSIIQQTETQEGFDNKKSNWMYFRPSAVLSAQQVFCQTPTARQPVSCGSPTATSLTDHRVYIIRFEMKVTHKWQLYDHFWPFVCLLYGCLSQN